MDDQDVQRPRRSALAWPGPVCWVCYGLLAAILLYTVVLGWLKPVWLDEPIGVEPALVGRVQQRLDPNTAPWWELARLPGIGPTLARRIVRYRQQHRPGRAVTSAPAVFERPEDLAAIRGIGPKTIQRLRAYLKFEPR